jgi:hypothetical protein
MPAQFYAGVGEGEQLSLSFEEKVEPSEGAPSKAGNPA